MTRDHNLKQVGAHNCQSRSLNIYALFVLMNSNVISTFIRLQVLSHDLRHGIPLPTAVMYDIALSSRFALVQLAAVCYIDIIGCRT